ncbi:non-ribosomal peptide synthase/polyketide synthase [Pseudomonas sp. PCH44]|uniref:non-ribosomal peptide synthase/polyketide synthase n=1 Tax=Pseudomonas sp. PCH44 TaxID=2800904 RepID=UPI001BAF7401|nr:non-ribosomal peptide synthase/polyketide synthase [Pseudomonas sp. PCH44]MBS3183954.1 non-ribosomal peptide synthase/polyketide synthase [Pseudomonas sp. PCH44]
MLKQGTQQGNELVQRISGLNHDKRVALFKRLLEKGVDLGRLPIVPLADGETLRLSHAQQRQWVLWQLDPQGAAYNMVTVLRLRGALNLEALRQAFDDLATRHQTLRTRFFLDADGQPRQCIEAAGSLTIDTRQLGQTDEPALLAAIEAEATRPFDLETGPLLRVALLEVGDADRVLVLTQHHIVSDGWSMQLMVDELISLYQAHCQGVAAQLPALPIQYVDYAGWQRQWLAAGERERQLNYWTQRLAGEQGPLELPFDRPRPARRSSQGSREILELPTALLQGIRQLAQAQGCTPFMVLLASFQLLLHRYSGQADIRVGVPSANRNRAETERLLGFFVNTQVLRADVDSQAGFLDLLKQVRQAALEAQAHQDLPFEQLVEALQPERSLSRSPLFQVMFNYQVSEGAISDGVQLPGLDVAQMQWAMPNAQFDLSLDCVEHPQGLSASLIYSTDLFDAPRVQRMAVHWQNLLQAIIEAPAQRMGDLPMLHDDERALAITGWNATARDYPGTPYVHQLFEQQAARQPQAPALTFADRTLSYAELNAEANRLAQYLRSQGVGPDVLVGIAAERSVEMVVGLLAILKAGGAYVPLDPEYPQDRLAYMFEDSGITLLLTQSHLRDGLPIPAGLAVLDLDRAEAWSALEASNPAVELHPENLAYVIYTSGSTGKPKGAGNRHVALHNRLAWMQEAYQLTATDSVLQKTPFSFDVSVWEFFWPLMEGARLVMALPGDHRDPARLAELITRERISTLHFVPSMLQAFVGDENAARCTSLQRIFCSGEALPVELQRQTLALLPQSGLYNLYGPTEAAIDVTHWTCVEEGKDAVPIGQPIANLQTYVLDGELNPVSPGVTGELYLGGIGLARGYHRRPSLTAERFVTSPFGTGQRLYRTGDLARQREDGVIEYAGRIDHQVKIRGLRIELGEIEARLQEQDTVREAVVVAADGPSGKQLVAYVVPEPTSLARAEAEIQGGYLQGVKAQLQDVLPDYMVPAQWVLLEQMPLSPNGKLDRKALPKPDPAQSRSEYQAPRNALEQRLALIWQEVLRLEQVGVDDNFFELGGDSIISIQIVSRARQAGIRFAPRDLFQHQSIRRLATVAQLSETLQIDQGPVTGEAPLLPIQQTFFATEIPNRQHWNQSLLLAPSEPLDSELLTRALAAVMQQHDALRLRYQTLDGGWVQHHQPQASAEGLIWQKQLASLDELPAYCSEVQRSLDLGAGPMLRLGLITLPDGTQRLLLAIHHLVIDGVSWRILLEDLQTAYRQLQAGQVLQLPAKTTSYKAWGERLGEHARCAPMVAQLGYWQQLLEGAPQDLPRDNPQGGMDNRHARSVATRLDATRTRQLLQEAPAAYRTQVNDLLLTALAQVVCAWSGEASALVQLEGHGREDLFSDIDLSRTLGWFTSLFPVRLTPASDLGAAIKGIKEQLRATPDKGLGHGLLRHLGSDEARAALAALAQPRITFNYLGQFDGDFADGALWVPASEGRGAGQDPQAPLGNWLSVDGQVFGGELSLNWTFSGEVYAEATIARLAEAYQQALEALIAHCLVESNAGLTPSDVPLAGLGQAQLDALALPARAIAEIYPLSPMQQGMLFHSLYEASGRTYVNQMRLDIRGLDVERFASAWQQAVDRHELLRAGFLWDAGLEAPRQVIHRQASLEIVVEEGGDGTARLLDERAGHELDRGFDLACPPLLRLCLLRTGADSHHVIYTSHHILMDGWSNSRLLGEVLQSYAGQAVAAPEGRYQDYLAWLQGQDQAASERFWQAQLAPLEEPTRLALACARADLAEPGQALHSARLNGEQTRRLQAFARQQQVTLNTLVQSAWLLLLQRYTGQRSVAFGATVSGRPVELPGIEQQLGLFINSLPVIASPDGALSVAQWAQAVQAQNLALRDHEHTPLADVQRLAGRNGEALFDTLLVFENYPVSEALQAAPGGLGFSNLGYSEQSGYALTLIAQVGDELELAFNYLTQDFAEPTIRRIAGQLTQLLLQFMAHPDSPLGELPLLEENDRQQVVEQWNATARSYPGTPYVHQLFEQHVMLQPQAPALTFADRTLSYAELNAEANRLAQYLRSQGVGPDVLVGIAAERSVEMVVGLLAILKAGGAYVPLDPEYPQDRLAYMFEDSGITLLLTQSHLRDGLPIPAGLAVLDLDRAEAWDALGAHNPEVALHPENLAYVIYTSGSTGKPKGAGNRHVALHNRLAWMQEAYQLTATDSVLQKTPFSFDVSVWEFFWPLMEGARLVMALPGDHRDPARLAELITRERISTLHFVPSMLQAFVGDENAARCTSLQRIICSGEALPVELQRQTLALLPQSGLYNLYGPTEAAIDVTHWTCVEEGKDAVPIGQPIANLQTYVLDGELNPVSPGVTGELYLGGIGLARGYHRRPSLTAERFVTSPFGTGQRLYRTGDLARQREDGVIEYAGRIDHQVKIRGLRIELGEIEARLQEQDAVREAVVVAADGPSGKQLVAYLVAGQADSLEAIKAHLAAVLPDYMVPAQWVLLERMPLSPNGKLDRKALPKPELGQSRREYVAPQSDLEQRLAGIWQDVLKVEQVGLNDNFFELGGDSIVSIQLVSRARQQGLRFTPKDVFEQQTLQRLAGVVDQDEASQVEQGPVTGEAPLLPIQQLFFETDIPARHHWNQALLLAPVEPLDGELLHAALQHVTLHHDALRLRYRQDAAGWVQYHAAVDQAVQLQCVQVESLEPVAAEAQRSLSLQHGPLCRALLASLADGSQRLLLVAHHLVIDGVSWRILLEDLQATYRQLQQGGVPRLPAKTSAYKAWGESLVAHAQSQAMNDELSYWQAQLAEGGEGILADHPEGSQAKRHARTLTSRFDLALTRALLQEAPAAYRTQVNDLLLTALAQALCAWSGEASALVQLEGHGREELFDAIDLSRTLGWFTSLYPVRLQPAADIGTSIKRIKEQLRSVPNKGIGYGLLRHLGPQAAREVLAALPQPRITFNYLGQFDTGSAEDALWRLADESAGSGIDDDAPLGNWLSLDGQVHEGVLSLSWTFSTCTFEASRVQALATAFEDALQALVEHCQQPANRGVTATDFPLAGLDQAQLDALPVAVDDIEDVYALSPMQEGMLFHTLSDGGSALYVNQVCLPVEGLDPQRFAAAWQRVMARHDILRTSFHWQGLPRPVQVVHRQARLDFEVLDWRGEAVDEQRLAARAEAECARGFDLTRAPLQRLLLIRVAEQGYHMAWTSHHILMDGWSSSQLFGEVMEQYHQGSSNAEVGRYRDFIAWLQRQDQGALEGFWKARLQRLDEPTSLSQAVHPRHVSDEPGHHALYTRWDGERTARLQQRCRELRITANTLVQGAWLLLLQRYTGQAAPCFGATVAGRPEGLAGADRMLGLFINTLPVIGRMDAEQTLLDWLQALQRDNLELREHAHAPLADVQRWSGQGGQPLFDSIIVFENYPIDQRLGDSATSGLSFGQSSNHDVTNFPMDLAVHLGEQLSIEYLYLRGCFSEPVVQGIRAMMEHLLEEILANPQVALGNLQRLPAAQRSALQGWSTAPGNTWQAQSLVELIARHAEQRPQALAVQCGAQQLDYLQLERSANRLAHRLQALGAGPEVVVGVALERSVQTLVALLAVMKSGAAYLPLDIDYPAERLAYMVEDSGMGLLITENGLQDRVPAQAALQRLLLDAEDQGHWPETAPVSQARPGNLAYLIYTSGSTGRPKGVAVPQGPLSMHCQAIAELYEMEPGVRELHFMSFAFDGAHERWLTTLMVGGTLVIRDGSLWTPEQTCRALHEQRIDIACFPPAYLKQMAEFVEGSGMPAPPVRIYCFGGDAVPERSFEQVRAALRPRYFTNGYGPTETVVTPLLWKAAGGDHCGADYAPIGRAVGERSLHVLDEQLNPLPVGFPGELYIGGEGVARGYQNRPGQSAERFMPDPFGKPGARLYRTGDLVRLREDGILDYLGRIDQQVKIRGFRIELGEVEAALRRQPGVEDALVVARDSASGKQLVGYVVGEPSLSGDRLKMALRASLPDWMVPMQVMVLPVFPVTPNGKLDRKALPEPSFQQEAYVAPRNLEEQLLAEIWAQVLQVEQVGIEDNFFELGGDSILSLQVVSRVKNHPGLELDLKLRDLLRYQTIAGICERPVETVSGKLEDHSLQAGEGAFRLLPIQEWLFAEDMREPQHFNQALMLKARGALDLDALERALGVIQRHHDSLRLRFSRDGGRWLQHYLAEDACAPQLWRREAADAQALEQLANQAQRSLDLGEGPMWRAMHVSMADGEARLLLVIHHLVVDAVSWRVLLEDLRTAYEACCLGQEPRLPMRSSSYRAWVERLVQDAGRIAAEESDWWLGQLDRAGQDLPCDNPRGRNQVSEQAVARVVLDSTPTSRLLKEAPAAYGTQINDLLLTALGRVLCRWSEQESVLVQLEGHGREDVFEALDLSRTLGWFTSMFPVRLQPEADIGSSILAIQGQLQAVPNKGIGYGVLRYLGEPALGERLARLPQARITFNYLGQFDQSFDDKALLVPAAEGTGDCYSPVARLGNWLEIIGQVYDGCLALRCVYSTRRYRPETVQALMDDYRAELELLIDHCLARLG